VSGAGLTQQMQPQPVKMAAQQTGQLPGAAGIVIPLPRPASEGL